MAPTRALAGLLSVALAILGLVALFPDCASACSCAALPGTPQERARDALSRSAAVFSGEVVKVDQPSLPLNSSVAPVTVTFRVSESWKGPERRMLEVKTPVSDVSCGYSFRSGESYLVYASEASMVEGEGLEVLLCGETKPLSEASADLEAFGDGKAPGAGLSDTSGSVPVRAVVVSAGIALVASFVLMIRLLRTG